MLHRFWIASAVFLVGGFLLSAQCGQAIGLSPAILEVNDLLSTNSVERNFWFSRSATNKAESLKIIITGQGAAAISLPRGSELTLPVGQDSVAYPIIINGQGLALGDYEARLVVEPLGSETPESGSNITVGSSGTIKFNITDELKKDWEITSVNIEDAIAEAPVNLRYTLRNNGNVEAKPEAIIFQATNIDDQTSIITEEISADQLTATAPFSESSFVLPLASQFPQGFYSIQLSFFQDDQVIYENRQLNLQIGAENSYNESWLEFWRQHYLAVGGAALFILVIVVVMFYIIIKK